MRQARLCVLLLSMIAAGCGHNASLEQPATQANFGVEMARSNLWREAMFRFRRAVELDPQSALAHNNLAVALEANGDFENAAKEYREALKLDRSNQYIQKNYSRFVEFTSRNKKRQRQNATASQDTTAGATTAATQTSAQQPPASAAPAPAATPPPPATSTAPPATPPPTPNPPRGGSR